jgi:DNA invertase Pin-like site-specific DNA recombinase
MGMTNWGDASTRVNPDKEFETNLRRERQMEGIAKAKAAGVYKGRKPSIDVTTVRKVREEGLGPAAIAKRLKIGRASVYRLLGS